MHLQRVHVVKAETTLDRAIWRVKKTDQPHSSLVVAPELILHVMASENTYVNEDAQGPL